MSNNVYLIFLVNPWHSILSRSNMLTCMHNIINIQYNLRPLFTGLCVFEIKFLLGEFIKH